jgi:uncharacterized protein (DUF1501 family)
MTSDLSRRDFLELAAAVGTLSALRGSPATAAQGRTTQPRFLSTGVPSFWEIGISSAIS